MRPHRLLNLLAANAGRGEFRCEANTILLYDVIVSSDADAAWLGGTSVETIVRALGGMTGPLALRINSPGGDVFAAVALAQAVRAYEGGVTVHVDGLAASAASIVAIAGDRVIMAPGAMMMIHKAWTIALGNSVEFLETAALLEKIDGEIAQAYTRKTGRDDDFSALMAAETWLTAEEAMALGLADAMAEAKPKVAAAWDLSAYAGAPAQAASEIEPAPSNTEHRSRVHAARMLAFTA
jgi:ATP-dependent Clp protease, protease subunit